MANPVTASYSFVPCPSIILLTSLSDSIKSSFIGNLGNRFLELSPSKRLKGGGPESDITSINSLPRSQESSLEYFKYKCFLRFLSNLRYFEISLSQQYPNISSFNLTATISLAGMPSFINALSLSEIKSVKL